MATLVVALFLFFGGLSLMRKATMFGHFLIPGRLGVSFVFVSEGFRWVPQMFHLVVFTLGLEVLVEGDTTALRVIIPPIVLLIWSGVALLCPKSAGGRESARDAF